jgi:hypothetical protein
MTYPTQGWCCLPPTPSSTHLQLKSSFALLQEVTSNDHSLLSDPRINFLVVT